MGVPELFEKTAGELEDIAIHDRDWKRRRNALYELFVREEVGRLKNLYKHKSGEIKIRAGEYLKQLGYNLEKI